MQHTIAAAAVGGTPEINSIVTVGTLNCRADESRKSFPRQFLFSLLFGGFFGQGSSLTTSKLQDRSKFAPAPNPLLLAACCSPIPSVEVDWVAIRFSCLLALICRSGSRHLAAHRSWHMRVLGIPGDMCAGRRRSPRSCCATISARLADALCQAHLPCTLNGCYS